MKELEGESGKIAEHTISRGRAALMAAPAGLLMGAANCFVDVDFSLRPELFAWAAAAIVAVAFLHEAIHGLAALLLGHRPVFGFKPPLIYTTFRTRIPRGHFILVALAPLIVLDVAAGILFAYDVANTLGATGDLWIVWKLATHVRGTLVQDTMTGIEGWRP
ncbi:MAG: DUF3267 domain-containing protein [Planctomycetota bacterium]